MSDQDFPPGYNHFPEKITWETISAYICMNPFGASMVSESRDGKPEIDSRLPLPGEKATWFQQFTSCLDMQYPRFHLTLKPDLSIESCECFTFIPGGGWDFAKLSEEEKIRNVVTLITFYFESIHSAIHIFHLIMVSAMYDSSKISASMNVFAKPYYPNIVLTYEEVAKLLINDSGLIDGALVNFAWKSDRDRLLTKLADLVTYWGHLENAEQFLTGFLGIGSGRPDPSYYPSWIVQFRAHLHIVPEHAKAIYDYMISQGDFKVVDVDKALGKFLRLGGERSFNVSGVQQWIELMSCTGLLHGCTLSATRMFFTKEGHQPFLFPEVDTFTEQGLVNIALGMGTIIGITPGHDVFTNIQFEAEPDAGLMRIIGRYTEKAYELKKAYEKSVDLSSDEFRLHGWLMTDYFSSLYDNKQLTLTSYI